MLGWFRALMPKQERFFEYFVQHAQVTLVAAEALRALVSGTGDPLRYCNEVHERELEADEITRNVLTALRRSFITPLDRGDIKDLITSMDDAIDQMNRTVKLIRLYEVRNFTPIMKEMGELIVQASKVSLEAVPLSGATMRRKRWASSRSCCSPKASSAKRSMFRFGSS
jgi:uncharacterized protein Yka (UPF0111/DUF47 family)